MDQRSSQVSSADMRIPLIGTARQFDLFRDDIHAIVDQVFSQNIDEPGNPFVKRFEQEFAAYIGRTYAIGLASGTVALCLALEALNIGPGDEVITTPFTFQATAASIAHVGARPIFVDVLPDSLLMDDECVASVITPHTRAVLPVHLYGLVVPMSRLQSLAATYNLILVEDCAQATGSIGAQGMAGSFGYIACYSFGPTKNLCALGEAGGVVSDDGELCQRIRQLAGNGSVGSFLHTELGTNAKLDALNAAFLSFQLRHIDARNQQRLRIAKRYQHNLSQIEEVRVVNHAGDPAPVYSKFTLRAPARDQLRAFLARHSIEACVYYPTPLHLQPCFRSLGYLPGSLPVAEVAAREVISLPIYPELADAEIDDICSMINDFYRHHYDTSERTN